MKNLILLLILFIPQITWAEKPEMKEIREMYFLAAKNEDICLEMIDLLSEEPSSSLLKGYLGSAEMLMAKHAFNPFTKMDYFKKGSKKLDESIAKDPDNIELRSLRLAVQKNAPSFLNYSGNIQEDRQLIMESWLNIKDPSVKKHLLSLLERSESMSSSELGKLKENI